MFSLRSLRDHAGGAPRLTLIALCVAILIVAATRTGHSVQSMDGRTYAQMIHGIAEHGLPYWDNGPIDRFTELVVQWGVPSRHDGHIWGIYSPLYPYLCAPAFRLGGLLLVSRFTFALLTIVASCTYLLAKRFVENEWYAALAAVLVVVSTPMLGHSLELTPFPLVAGLATLALYLTTRVVSPDGGTSDRRQRTDEILCGVTWAMACSAHILSFPMAIGAIAVIAVAPPRSLMRLGRALAGFVTGLMPMAFLNHLRFDSWNPISYGPIPWTGQINGEGHKMTLVNQLRYSAPAAMLVLACIAVIAVIAMRMKAQRHRRVLIGAVVLVFTLMAIGIEPLRERFTKYAMVACGYIIDVTVVDMGPAYPRAADGWGRYFASAIIKSTLQSVPILILAPLVFRFVGRERRWSLYALLTPCVLLYLSFMTRANLSYPDALGWPCIHIRYTFPALPALLVASCVVVEQLRPRKIDFAFAALVAIGVNLAYEYTPIDLPNQLTGTWRRMTIVLAPLVLGVAAIATVMGAHYKKIPNTVASLVVSLTLGLGVSVGVGHDLRCSAGSKQYVESLVDRFVPLMPPRFALIGKLGEFDMFLTTTATHDVEYADVLRLDRFEDLHSLIEYWRSVDRPMYFVTFWPGPPYNPWPNDVVFTRVSSETDPLGVYSVDRVEVGVDRTTR